MRRQRRYVAADAIDRLADCRCAGCGQVDTDAIREDWWRRQQTTVWAPTPSTANPPQLTTSGQAELER